MAEGQSIDDPIQRYDDALNKRKAGIEELVGAQKKYYQMTQLELREERKRLSNQLDRGYDTTLAKEKLSEAAHNRSDSDRKQLKDRIDSDLVQEGFIRMYRGEDENGLGQYGTTEQVAGRSGKWFTTDFETAASFAQNLEENGRLRYMDIPESDFKAAIAMTNSNKTDIQIPVGYDLRIGSKVLMSDGSIPAEIAKNSDREPTKTQ